MPMQSPHARWTLRALMGAGLVILAIAGLPHWRSAAQANGGNISLARAMVHGSTGPAGWPAEPPSAAATGDLRPAEAMLRSALALDPSNRAAARECVEHLISVGRTRIAIMTGPPALQTARERLEGYVLGLETAGIAFDSKLVLEGDFRVDSGYELGRQALNRADRPDALFVSNNTMAMGVLRAVEDLNLRCPEDVAIAIFDDLPLLFALRPHLTAVSQPAYAIGRNGVELLLDRIEGRVTGPKPVHVTLQTELKIRESTARRG